MLMLVIVWTVSTQITSYVDAEGTTHYVDSPSKIPAKYRKNSKTLDAELQTVESRKVSPQQAQKERLERLARERRQEEADRLEAARKKALVPSKPATVDPNSPEERRRRWEQAMKEPPSVQVGHLQNDDPAVNVRFPGADGLKNGEACRAREAACAVPPECCSNRCNPTTFKCE